MPVDRHIMAHPILRPSPQEFRSLRSANSDGVDQHSFLRSSLDGRGVDAPQEFEIGTRTIDSEECYANAVLSGEADGVSRALYRFVRRNAISLQLNVAGGN